MRITQKQLAGMIERLNRSTVDHHYELYNRQYLQLADSDGIVRTIVGGTTKELYYIVNAMAQALENQQQYSEGK